MCNLGGIKYNKDVNTANNQKLKFVRHRVIINHENYHDIYISAFSYTLTYFSAYLLLELHQLKIIILQF